MTHATIYAVLESLPHEVKDFWGIANKSHKEISRLVEKGSLDLYEGRSESEYTEMMKLLVFYDSENKKRLFHYLPIDTNIHEGCGAWQSDSTSKWKIVDRGFREYLRKITNYMVKYKKDEALICTLFLCHFLQDQTAFFHSMEGEEGTSPWIFDELIDLPQQSPVSFLNEFTPDFSMDYYNPSLLGTSNEEVAFHLYQKYRATKRKNRRMLIPLIQASCIKDKQKEMVIREKIGKSTAELTADLFHTIFCIFTENYKKRDTERLKKVCLPDIIPINYPRHLSQPYGFNSIVKNNALDINKHTIPLILKVNGKERKFKNGIAMGCHKLSILTYHIPKNVFKHFSGYIGLHSKFCDEGNVEFEISLGQKILTSNILNRKTPSYQINSDVSKGGLLTFKFKSATVWNNPANNLVLAEPFLLSKNSSVAGYCFSSCEIVKK